ncbi:probable smad nuclear-interacting protein 1 at C-terminar half [Coccomyxa sp. Obi]|nr:probable smad nuclear-interacting protein 1 at C-terminar half [Coccomyxa sp. Obi]
MAREGSSSSSSSGSGSSASSDSSSSSSQSRSPAPQRSPPLPRRDTSPKRGLQKEASRNAQVARRAHSRSRSPREIKRRRQSPPRRDRADSPHRRRADSPRRRKDPPSPDHRRRGDRLPPPRRGDTPSRRRDGDSDLPRDRRRDGGRSRFDERAPEDPEGGGNARAANGEAADGKPSSRGRTNRWESSAAADQPLPGPPPGPPQPRREDRDWNHQSRDQALPKDEPKQAVEVEPNYGLSGKLAEESNTVRGVVMLHNEPPEARKPSLRWRLYTFKNGEPFGEPLYIHRQSCYLFGRERRVADVPTDHPSCSKQHAVLQYRYTEKEGGDGMMSAAVRPYLMDLGSTNGSFLNGERIDSQRYYELYEKDLIRFGNSSREYVLLHEKSSEAQ